MPRNQPWLSNVTFPAAECHRQLTDQYRLVMGFKGVNNLPRVKPATSLQQVQHPTQRTTTPPKRNTTRLKHEDGEYRLLAAETDDYVVTRTKNHGLNDEHPHHALTSLQETDPGSANSIYTQLASISHTIQ